MDDETLAALKGSIAKWEGIAAGACEDLGAINCPLCQAFMMKHPFGSCAGCPIMERTGQPVCRDTPYEHFISIDRPNKKRGKNYFAAAQAEVDFLKSLLPKANAV